MTFGARVKHARQVVGLTQGQLSELSGVKVATIRGWENRVREDTHASWLLRVAAALNVCPFWLFFGIGDPHGGTVGVEELKSLPAIRFHEYGRKK
jgi:transcriptional regulator with XRE-family HTH domain